jgi:hypothetical protein
VIFQGIYCYPDWSKILIKIHWKLCISQF